ncbi:type II toxin-antitoxin system Phd/YefM family antitoxin [Ferrovum myxofaciens]|uniref:Antitoxin n=2 Tax=root TaxID=1 RepID=A0A859AB20_9PROT|nr:type II toxin-antitoxin system Phd/YefM family antitoxin [Ferrovum myxofaciens]KXW57013.1 Phd_YefM [Ferrovum myxofaciens]MBU6993455.1 type II toxin-antitoxin system Phd/YefM family antitoxin [Ferrovum myxofaciens]QKE39124.1 MAG: type II toxin-antitoxin system Phd/YefM family antitoxin [Ferrovum myxofaciens]QKE39142.1 MAG: type II toxin-antitoxin system Phd/YefM family antitoxin [Ferrovum myxofaciens]QWY74362.1 MAG: type II toxin-antitoxin system Phd/YefM family antitoxin [Ferrovum myxofacie
MDISTIAQAKNHLPKLIHAAEAGDDIRISRHGKLVAVIISAERYQQHFNSGTGIFQAIMEWREKQSALDLTDTEVDSWRDRAVAREFSWE